MILRRTLLATGAVMLARPAMAAPRATDRFVVGLLTSGNAAAAERSLAPCREKLTELGYVEGKNIRFEVRSADGRFGLLPSLAVELIALHPDVIYVTSTPALMALYKAQADIPVVFAGIGPDPIGLGVVQSMPHPGGNFTGITNNVVELNPKRMQLFRELLPQATRLAYFSNPLNGGGSPAQDKAREEAAMQFGFQLLTVEIKSAEDFPAAFAKAFELKAEALFGSADPLSVNNRDMIIRLAAEYKLPVIYNFRFEVTDGGLIAYGPDLDAQYRSAAIYIDKVLRSEKTADLPVERATKLFLVINLQTAKALNLTIPSVLLARADEVIE
jgi:putative tryptophan/tyrosine transport system substrate-binding protein